LSQLYLDVKTTVCKQIINLSENHAASNVQYFSKLPFRRE